MGRVLSELYHNTLNKGNGNKGISKCSITFAGRFVSLFLMLRESIVFKNA
jgi:hypothetical protein